MCRVFRIVSGRATEILPLLTLGGIAMCLSGMSFVYLIVSIYPIKLPNKSFFFFVKFVSTFLLTYLNSIYFSDDHKKKR
jgi:hypothetical protein